MTLNTFLRSIIAGIFIIISGYTYGVLRILSQGKLDTFYPAAKWWAQCILSICKVKLSFVKTNAIPQQAIYIANHVSLADTPIMINILPENTRIMYKSELDNAPGIGIVLRRSPYISVHRKSVRKAALSIVEARNAIQNGDSIMLFPEGTWSEKPGDLLPFKLGAFTLSKNENIPIIPMIIVGTEHIIPKDSIFIHEGTVHVTMFPPLYPESFDKAETLSEACRNIILTELHKHYS
jgi:1-acyl-sn-glycerol-3-phosphate acyltransferase